MEFLTKWPLALILNVQNSLSIAFLAISDRYATLFFFKFLTKCLPSITFLAILDQYGIFYFLTKWPPALILNVQNSLSITFLAISDRYATLFFWEILTKWLPSAILDVRNSLLIVFLGHFRSIRNFIFFGNFWQNGCRRPFWIHVRNSCLNTC